MILAIDTETTGTDFFHGCRPFMISMCTGKFNYLFIGSVDPSTREVTWNTNDLSQVIDLINQASKIVMHNAFFDIRALESIGIPSSLIFPKIEDTLIASHILCSGDEHGLKDLAIKYLQYWDDDEQDLQHSIVALRNTSTACIAREGHPHFPGVTNAKWWKMDMWLDIPLCSKYAIKDAERTWLLWKAFYIGLLEDKAMPMYNLRRDLIQVVYDMQTYGIHIYKDQINNLIRHLDFQEKCIINEIKKLSGYIGHFDPNKPGHLVSLLHHYLKIPILYTTENNNPSVNKDALDDYINLHNHPALQYLQIWREISTEKKYLTSYILWGIE